MKNMYEIEIWMVEGKGVKEKEAGEINTQRNYY